VQSLTAFLILRVQAQLPLVDWTPAPLQWRPLASGACVDAVGSPPHARPCYALACGGLRCVLRPSITACVYDWIIKGEEEPQEHSCMPAHMCHSVHRSGVKNLCAGAAAAQAPTHTRARTCTPACVHTHTRARVEPYERGPPHSSLHRQPCPNPTATNQRTAAVPVARTSQRAVCCASNPAQSLPPLSPAHSPETEQPNGGTRSPAGSC